MAAGAGFFYSKCEFLARGIFPFSPPVLPVARLVHARARARTKNARTHERRTHTNAAARARVRALVSDDGAGNGVSDETELTQVDLPRRWRGAPDT